MTVTSKRCLSCGAGLPEDGLLCSFCGAAHVVTGVGGLGLACHACGAGNRPDAGSCVQCRAALVVTCPECRARSPVGGRFCQECRIDFGGYRRARVERALPTIGRGQIDEAALAWLDSGLLRARDVRERTRIIEATLVWIPVWRFTGSASGEVQGANKQVHHRTTTRRELDAEGKWRDVPDSVPYDVWSDVTKRFDDQALLHTRLACADAGPFMDVLPEATLIRSSLTLGGMMKLFEEKALRPTTTTPCRRDELGAEPWERVFEPASEDLQVYGRCRSEALAGLRARLLDRVDRLEVTVKEPRLSLAYHPVWHVIYRYGRAHGEVRVCGVTGEARGKSLSLLDQWFK